MWWYQPKRMYLHVLLLTREMYMYWSKKHSTSRFKAWQNCTFSKKNVTQKFHMPPQKAWPNKMFLTSNSTGTYQPYPKFHFKGTYQIKAAFFLLCDYMHNYFILDMPFLTKDNVTYCPSLSNTTSEGLSRFRINKSSLKEGGWVSLWEKKIQISNKLVNCMIWPVTANLKNEIEALDKVFSPLCELNKPE